MSSSIPTERFVPYHIYERDMERINHTLDKLIEYVQLGQIAQARQEAAHAVEEKQEDEETVHGKAVKLVVLGAFLALVVNAILSAVQIALG